MIDRMITLEVAHQDRETELAIVRAKSQRSSEEAGQIVDIIRAMRQRLGSKKRTDHTRRLGHCENT